MLMLGTPTSFFRYVGGLTEDMVRGGEPCTQAEMHRVEDINGCEGGITSGPSCPSVDDLESPGGVLWNNLAVVAAAVDGDVRQCDTHVCMLTTASTGNVVEGHDGYEGIMTYPTREAWDSMHGADADDGWMYDPFTGNREWGHCDFEHVSPN